MSIVFLLFLTCNLIHLDIKTNYYIISQSNCKKEWLVQKNGHFSSSLNQTWSKFTWVVWNICLCAMTILKILNEISLQRAISLTNCWHNLVQDCSAFYCHLLIQIIMFNIRFWFSFILFFRRFAAQTGTPEMEANPCWWIMRNGSRWIVCSKCSVLYE